MSQNGSIHIIKLKNPPVNALGHQLRMFIVQQLQLALMDDSIQAILLYGDNHNFSAGADIKEFGGKPLTPILPDVCEQIDTANKPVVVAIEGNALGGGLELALAAHHRVASSTARLGLPEVNLGLLPGAGGTQRLPRLVGMEPALDMILTGKIIDGKKAKAIGLIDALIECDETKDGVFLEQALHFVASIIDQPFEQKRTSICNKALQQRQESEQQISQAEAQLSKKYRGLFSPKKIIDCLKMSLHSSFLQGIQFERESFLACMDSPQRQGLIHAFFAEKQAAKLPDIKNISSREIKKTAVIGGGTMGAGIAVCLLNAGLPVIMLEKDEDSLSKGYLRVEKVYEAMIAKGRMQAKEKQEILNRFVGTTKYQSLVDVDLVIEAVFEDMEVKKAVFQQLDKYCPKNAVLATNTSYLDINEIANSITRSQDVIGLHFFSPAYIMKLLEVVISNQVADDVIVTAFALAKKLKKQPVRAGVCDGFIGNRILAKYRQAADFMMEDGASPYQIDDAVRHFGFPMGPYEVADLAGGDIGWATRKRRAKTRKPNERYVRIPDLLCEKGWFGQKTGRGYYLYQENPRKGTPDDEVLEIINEERKQIGIQTKSFSEEQIIDRYMAAMINEGANVVYEKIALRPLDVDVVLISGYGFPRYKGGPMKYADEVGLDKILSNIEKFAQEDSIFWQPSPLLVELVKTGKNFESLNHKSNN